MHDQIRNLFGPTRRGMTGRPTLRPRRSNPETRDRRAAYRKASPGHGAMRRATAALMFFGQCALAATPVTTRPLAELLITAERSAPATVEALNSPALAAEISARITAIPVRVGDRVDAGALLAALDCRHFESQQAAARAGLEDLEARQHFAARQLARARDLRKQRSISEETVEQREADLASLNAQLANQQETLAQAQLQVEHCTVRAPFPAVVTDRLADVGSLAAPGTPLVRLVQLGAIEVSAELREAEATELPQAAGIWFAYQGMRHPVTLRHLLPVVDTRKRTREARLEFRETAAPAGAAGRLVWQQPQLAVPAELLVRRDGRLGLFVLDGEHARFHVLPDAIEGQPATLDLSPQTRVIVDGRQGLNDGDAVEPAAIATPPGDG